MGISGRGVWGRPRRLGRCHRRSRVRDALRDRSAETTARWLGQHPSVEMVSRDRCDLDTQGAAQGAPQAWQVADRFHLLQNLRQAIEQQLSHSLRSLPLFVPGETADLTEPPGMIHRYGRPKVTERRHLVQAGRRPARQSRFDRVKALQAEGKTLGADRPRNRIELAHGPQMDRTGCVATTRSESEPR